MGTFIFFVLGQLIWLMILAIIVSAILSWLVAFNVINLRNPFVYGLARFLDAVSAPVLRPAQKIIPPLGGVDISPIVVILVLQGVRGPLFSWLHALLYPYIG